MFMGKKHPVYAVYAMIQHLLSEIGAGIDYISGVIPLDHHRGSQSFVFGVIAQANRIFASDYWNSLRRTGA